MKTFVLLYNGAEPLAYGDARDARAAQGNLEALDAIEGALAPLGRVHRLETGDGDPVRLARELVSLDPTVVFNLAEAVRGDPTLEPTMPSLLELLGIAYTGNGPFTLALCLDKPRTKTLLRGSGVPTPAWRVVEHAERDALDGLRYPVIVKPAAMDASHGIDRGSVVHDEAAARARAALVCARYGPRAIVEEFVDGRELNVAIALGRVLPLAEVDWRLPPGVPRVLGYEEKWDDGSEADLRTPIVCPATIDDALAERVRSVARAAFEAVGGRDYARVDVRVDDRGEPFVLEVNPNPDIAPGAGLARAARVAGWSYDDFIRHLVQVSEERAQAPVARGA